MSRFRYTEEMCDCSLCMHFKRKQCTLPECACIEDRIKAGAVFHPELLQSALSTIQNPNFKQRLNEYITESEMIFMTYRGYDHRELFGKSLNIRPHADRMMMAALYLLTADNRLWSSRQECSHQSVSVLLSTFSVISQSNALII